MPELDNSKPPLFVPSKRSYNDFVLAWRGHSRKRNYSQLLEWAENPDNAPEALTQQQQTWNSRFFSDLVDSLYNGETDDAATAALAAMDAAADDGMQPDSKREIDITLPSARSHAEDQLKTKTKQKHDETVAEFGLRFRGAVREFKNRGGEMTNYKYAELFAANVHERHQRIALELVTDLDPDDDNAIIIPDIIRRTNERASLHDRIIRANPENRRRRLALPVQGRGGGRNGGRMGGRGGRNTERFDPQRHQRRCQNANCPAPHTHDTPMCYAPGGARHDPAGIKYNTNSNVPLKLIGYCDASWGDNHENRRSTSGYIFFLNGGPISWASYLQTTVALSTVESEVMALTEAIKEAIYIRRLLESLGAAQEGPTIIYTDSTGAEALVDHPTSHRRTKHIEIRREFIKFHIGHETVKIERVSTKDQLADIMTKPLRQDIHNYLVQMILHG
ncbi:RNA-dependent DNA polymerase [Pseudoscourfieldia marina]